MDMKVTLETEEMENRSYEHLVRALGNSLAKQNEKIENTV